MIDNMESHTPPNKDEPCLQSPADRENLERGLRVLTRASASLASFCEHIEHNEESSISNVVSSAEHLRDLAVELSALSSMSLLSAYSKRIAAVEAKSLLRHTQGDDIHEMAAGAKKLEKAETWYEIQLGQLVHDRQFHPDVFGISKIDQIRHYTFHVAKLAGLLADAIDNDQWEAFRDERLADIAVFGVKLATVCNVELARSPVDS